MNFASTSDPGSAIIDYQGALTTDPGATPVDSVAPGLTVPTPTEGQFDFVVRAVQDGGAAVAATRRSRSWSTAPARPSAASPSAARSASTAGSARRRDLVRDLHGRRRRCRRGAVREPQPHRDRQGNFANGERTVTVTDVLGNASVVPLPAFKYDSTVPTLPALTQPGSLVPEEPTFHWFPSTDTLSGVDHYVVQFRLAEDSDGPFINIAEVAHTGGPGEYSATRQPRCGPSAPENTLLDWRVRAFDKAGNIRSSALRQVTIDPTVPPAPAITGGPNAPTQNTSPTFTWEGTGDTFRWDVVVAGSENPIRSGAGPASQTTIAALSDGAYTFRVTQVTAAGRESAEAVRSFVVNTTAPGAPTILTRPTFPSLVTPVFTWSTEPGAYSRWSVLGGGGAVIAGPIDTPVTSATSPPSRTGPTASRCSRSTRPATSRPPPSSRSPSSPRSSPSPRPAAARSRSSPSSSRGASSRRRARSSRAGRPSSAGPAGPRGTKLFNLQIFRVTQVSGRTHPEASSRCSRCSRRAAPTGSRAARRSRRPATCWRVWPYTGREFTPKPLGVSNYCVASAKVLKKKAAGHRRPQGRARCAPAGRRRRLDLEVEGAGLEGLAPPVSGPRRLVDLVRAEPRRERVGPDHHEDAGLALALGRAPSAAPRPSRPRPTAAEQADEQAGDDARRRR